jgi:ribonuclease HI
VAQVATIFTDGAAEGNPGPGGYCAIVRIPGRPDRELSGSSIHTTNNKMELSAAIAGLKAVAETGATEIRVIADSEYLVKGMTNWLAGWVAKGWKTAYGQPVKNRELWEQLAELTRGKSVQWEWVRGHAGHPENERCDEVASAAARQAARARPT